MVKNPPANVGDARDPGLIPESGAYWQSRGTLRPEVFYVAPQVLPSSIKQDF